MTTAFLLLASVSACAAVLYLLTIFMQFLLYSAACTGCGMALLQIASMPNPTDANFFAMAALMAVIAFGVFHVFRSWGVAIKRLRLS